MQFLFHRPVHFLLRAAPAACAVSALLLAAGCAQAPQAPAVPPAQAVAPAAASDTPAPVAPITVVTVLEVYRTQQVERTVRERCGEQIAPPPRRSLWSRMFSSEPSRDDVEMPVPVFVPEVACDPVAAQRYGAAHYRVTYRFGNEVYMVDLDHDPGATVRVDATGRVLGPARLP